MKNFELIGLSYQMALRRQLDVVANNVANMNTTAFKGESMVFQDHLVRTNSADKSARKLSFVRDLATVRDIDAGRTEPTGGELDLAISGKGYFAVQTASGERYTRNGHFKINLEGQVVSAQGHPLLTEGDGTLTLQPGEKDITIAKDGTLSTNLGQKGKIKLVSFANEQELKQVGDSLYTTQQKPEPAASDSKILQGSIEQSNVRPVLEITKMMSLVRTYEQVSQAMNKAGDLSSEAIRELGRTPQA